jgi:hypothetical protein
MVGGRQGLMPSEWVTEMGASNVKSVYANWAHLSHGPFRLLAYMALTSLDADPVPRFWGGRESLAVAYGRLERMTSRASVSEEHAREREAAYVAVKRALRALKDAGAITLLNVPGPGHQGEYRLHLDGPAHASAPGEGIAT